MAVGWGGVWGRGGGGGGAPGPGVRGRSSVFPLLRFACCLAVLSKRGAVIHRLRGLLLGFQEQAGASCSAAGLGAPGGPGVEVRGWGLGAGSGRRAAAGPVPSDARPGEDAGGPSKTHWPPRPGRPRLLPPPTPSPARRVRRRLDRGAWGPPCTHCVVCPTGLVSL